MKQGHGHPSMDTWETVVGLLERHFSAGRSVQHTLQGMPIGAFGHCVAKPVSCVFIDGGNGIVSDCSSGSGTGISSTLMPRAMASAAYSASVSLID